jgi:glutaredoxin 3
MLGARDTRRLTSWGGDHNSRDYGSEFVPKIQVYTKPFCPYCYRALSLLDSKGATVEEKDISLSSSDRAEMLSRANGRTTVPQIFIGDRHIGGSDDLAALERAGELDVLLSA